MSIPAVLLEHFQELQELYGMRKTASRSPECTLADLKELDERIGTHIDGLLSSSEQSQPLLEAQLGGEDEDAVFSAAYVLLRIRTATAADSVLSAAQTAAPEVRAAFVEAMALQPIDLIQSRLQQIYESGPPLAASLAGEVLARHKQFPSSAKRLGEFFKHSDPAVRRAAWRIVPCITPHPTRGIAQGPV